MAKFGRLIESEHPVLFGFYDRSDGTRSTLDSFLDDIMQELEGRIKIYKIEAGENPELVKALKVKEFPSFVVYNKGKMVWRNNKDVNGMTLVEVLEHFL